MCCTLMGRRRAAFSRPFARPLASRLTDPTPAYTHRTLYSFPLHTQFARDHSRLHAHTHRPIPSASFFRTRIPTSFPSKHLDFCPPGLFPSPDFIPHHRIGHRCSVCSRVPSLTTSPLQGFSLRSTLASSICTSNTAITPESVQSTTLRYYTPFIHTFTHSEFNFFPSTLTTMSIQEAQPQASTPSSTTGSSANSPAASHHPPPTPLTPRDDDAPYMALPTLPTIGENDTVRVLSCSPYLLI